MRINVNGTDHELPAIAADTPLLYVLRNDLELTATKFGCGLGQCGACTVHINDRPVRSCVITLAKIAASDRIVTLEGLSTGGRSALQDAFIAEQAVQCGYCISGMIMTAAAFLATTPMAGEEEIKHALAGNLCRCGTHARIVRAVRRTAERHA